jgi:hypothetical protein
MIRRDDGNDWLLVPQIEHAHAAGEIAAAWRPFSPFRLGEGLWVSESQFTLPAEVLFAIRHHDDGWREWDAAPQIDVDTGVPRSFLEMPMSVATEIWGRSIDLCGDEHSLERTAAAPTPASRRESIASPLGGLAVSKHFCWLADLALGTRDKDDERSVLSRFLETQSRQQANWKNAILKQSRASEAEIDAAIELGFHAVQFFDRLSLWLCCAPRTDVLEMQFPGGSPFRFVPLGPSRVAIEPFPLALGAASSLIVSVAATRIAARRYADDDDLLRALHGSPSERITWTLTPA